MRLALLALLTLVSTVFGAAQGQLWNQRLDHNEVKIARGANGNIYAAGYVDTSTLYVPLVTCYNAAGQLLYRVVSGTGFGSNPVGFSDVHLVGEQLLFTIAFIGPSTKLFRLDTTMQTLTSVTLQSAGSDIQATTLAVGSTTYCIAGQRGSDGSYILQVRSLATDIILREVVTTSRLREVFLIGSFFYAIGTSLNPNRVVVHRANSSSNSSFSLNAPVASSSSPLQGIASGRFLYLISNYYDGAATNNIFVTAFNTQTLTFGTPWEEAAFETESVLVTAASLGQTSLFLGLHDRVLGISSTGTLLFENPYPEVSVPTFAATSATDAEGNVACLVDRSGETTFYRYGPTGLVLNRHIVGLPKIFPGQMTLDAAGVARFAYVLDDVGFLSSRWLGAVSQASLNLPGTYTVGGSNRIGTINIGGPAPAGRRSNVRSLLQQRRGGRADHGHRPRRSDVRRLHDHYLSCGRQHETDDQRPVRRHRPSEQL